MLAGINPNLVHVDGGAELSIYGDFPGDDLWPHGSTCGFEGVVEVNRARRISPLELRCVAPSRTVGFGRVFLMHRDLFGELTVRHHGMLEVDAWTLLGVVRWICGFLSEEYVEPLDLFEVHPREVVDGHSTLLRVWGSHFRPVVELRCGFASRQKRRNFLTWLGTTAGTTKLKELPRIIQLLNLRIIKL
eukprot:Skav206796  [mRNA]  locus=scaffold1990:123805:125130:- [translate_table: standard]